VKGPRATGPHDPEPSDDQDFAQWRSFLGNAAGVLSTPWPRKFGDDGSKDGEFEALLRKIDFGLLGKAMTETGEE